jgi:hypothetical protein
MERTNRQPNLIIRNQFWRHTSDRFILIRTHFSIAAAFCAKTTMAKRRSKARDLRGTARFGRQIRCKKRQCRSVSLGFTCACNSRQSIESRASGSEWEERNKQRKRFAYQYMTSLKQSIASSSLPKHRKHLALSM